MTDTELAQIRERWAKATPGPLATGIIEPERAEWWLAENLKFGSGPTWLVWVPEHPLTKIGDDPSRPEHAVTMAVTGNGPTSEANAAAIASAPQDIAALLAEVARLRKLLTDAPLMADAGGGEPPVVARCRDYTSNDVSYNPQDLCNWCWRELTPEGYCPEHPAMLSRKRLLGSQEK